MSTIDFTINSEDCITLACQIINIQGDGDYLAPSDYDLGKKVLNMMLKAWQMQDNHLWVKQTISLFLQKNQHDYTISQTTSDHFTADIPTQTYLTTDAISGDTTLIVNDTTGMSINDHIGIKLDNNTIFWSTINLIPTTTSVIINNPLPSASTTNNYIFSYKTPLYLPFQLYAAIRHDIANNIDIPINFMSYREYFDQPNKETPGTITMWSPDRQIDSYNIHVWPNPSDVSYYVKLIISRKIQDIDTDADNFDLPQEWQQAIVFNLALRLAPIFGKAQGENFAEIKNQAAQYLLEAQNFDNELGSIYIKPSQDGFRRP
jgi:hypothetical protein